MDGNTSCHFNEDITYEDYKSSKFHKEYLIMISVLSFFFAIATLIGGGFNMFLTYFPLFFLGLILTFFIFYLPIRFKYLRRINNLLRRKNNEE